MNNLNAVYSPQRSSIKRKTALVVLIRVYFRSTRQFAGVFKWVNGVCFQLRALYY